jgi:hypothetical protein
LGGLFSAIPFYVKKAVFKGVPSKNGFIQTTLAPVNDKNEGRFGWGDVATLIALIIGLFALARVLLKH